MEKIKTRCVAQNMARYVLIYSLVACNFRLPCALAVLDTFGYFPLPGFPTKTDQLNPISKKEKAGPLQLYNNSPPLTRCCLQSVEILQPTPTAKQNMDQKLLIFRRYLSISMAAMLRELHFSELFSTVPPAKLHADILTRLLPETAQTT